ncbi:hypothetical protein QP027_05440 [Corynebacterium breve]|uniref:FCS-type domain-containing protein n=1 Tax=Corynebacterium breve TaxID=3049799 RepID=A0ABY8VKV7_9CORY|nr:hypothetical protein [Corynebacterium breve]WIM68824.1 hypothetical protein QP027_05440 [Corynebacterium breve]
MNDPREPKQSTCRWCGTELVQPSGRGRRRKFCSASCKQRAYEQRNNVSGTSIPKQAVIIHPDKAEALRDELYELRCAAEDIATASAEGAGAEEIRLLCDELVALAKQIERLR